ncbi:MAG: undecaprenyldiphospho-muramoylpentapeptide beta-N-acetylglucosaminyltransferase [Bdellovibrionaceae bacterium]|nr:undecaprenyldiphospho-muramoylpentapeptide beta-N-acetylglucosaminyltransferase [Pseudobdellovibrionaceae bacterium]
MTAQAPKSSVDSAKRIVIAGGGTGGHIYPGVAIARSLIKKNPEIQIHFVGSPQGLEAKIVPREGFPLHLIQVGKLNYGGGIFGKLRTLFQLPKAFIESIFLLFELKPLFVLGVGGYASGPFVLMASLLGFKTAIWEPNAHPGLTNRWLSRFVRKSFVVFPEAGKYLKSREVIPSGIPVRDVIEKLGRLPNLGQQMNSQQMSDQHISDQQIGDLDSKKRKFRILVFGGSQGARGLNKIVSDLFAQSRESLKEVELVHQTGVVDFESLREKYKTHQGQVQVLEYLHDMENHYAWCDLVISRAGAATVAELAACNKAAILVPLPTAADNHQQVNAETLVRAEAARMILQKELTPDLLEKYILELKSDPELRRKMSENIRKFYKPQAAEAVAQVILEGAGV